MPRKRANLIPRLLGSYAAPRCRIGRQLACQINGDVEVDGITEAPVPWPYTQSRAGGVKRGGKPILIVCGDLARAIATESVAAVAHHWGISRSTVMIWRRALKVDRMTPGTQRLLMDHAHAKLTKLAPKVPAIRAGIAAGKTNQEIAKELRVRCQSVWRIRTGATFAEEQTT
jgi:hypothetical protein